MRTVSEVAELTGVTVRTLHHYDAIGLLSPAARSEAGYRLYSYEDLERLREILVWRQLGFALGDVTALLDDPAHDRLTALRRQRALVEADLGRLGSVARLLDDAISAHQNGIRQKEEEMFDHAAYDDEARERWGHTDAYKESARRTAAYGDAEWAAIKAESDAIVADYAALMADGIAVADPGPRAVAERHRAHIGRWFYDCSPEMHRRLGEMYVADERFGRNYDDVAPGLAVYVRDAMGAAADAVDSGRPAP
jgi:DNA-binding transcriptional MerR regulator